MPRVLKYATEDVDNPDLRDRGFIYWRLLSTNPIAAKVLPLFRQCINTHQAIVFSDRPAISGESENFDPVLLTELLLNLSSLASIYHKPPSMLVGGLKTKSVIRSPAYVDRSAILNGTNEP